MGSAETPGSLILTGCNVFTPRDDVERVRLSSREDISRAPLSVTWCCWGRRGGFRDGQGLHPKP